MGWKDWDRTNKVIVSVCAVVVVAVIATFAVLALRPNETTPPTPPPSPGTSQFSETPTPSPSPTYECTTATGSECTRDLAEKEAARDKAYADAEKTYREFHELMVDAMKRGDGKLPEGIQERANPKIQKIALDSLKRLKAQEVTYAGYMEVKYVRPAKDSPTWPTNKVIINSCLDGSNLIAYKGKDKDFAGLGSIGKTKVTMELLADKWQLVESYETKADKC